MNQIYPAMWIHLPREVRLHLTKVFKLECTGPAEIRDQEVISDGFTVEDLKKITLEKMNEYIGSVETFGRAWEITLAKVHSELNPPVGEIKTADGVSTIAEVPEPVVEAPVSKQEPVINKESITKTHAPIQKESK